MAAHRVRGARSHAALRRHVFPAGGSLGATRLSAPAHRDRGRLAGARAAVPDAAGRREPAGTPAPGRGAPRPARPRWDPHHLGPGGARGAAVPRRLRRRARRVRIGAEIPPQPATHAAAPEPSGAREQGATRRLPVHAPAHGRRRTRRPARGRIPSLFHGRRMAGAALREDALRQRAPRPGVSARSPDHRGGTPRGGRATGSRLDGTRDEGPGRGVLRGARRRFRGRRGAFLHLDRSRSGLRHRIGCRTLPHGV